MDNPPGNLKVAGYLVSGFNLNFITANATPAYKSNKDMVAKTSSCLNPPVMAIKKAMTQSVTIAQCGVEYLGCIFDK